MIDWVLPSNSVPATSLTQHPDEHRPKGPVLLAVDQQLGEGAASRIRDMQTTPRTKPHGEIARIALWGGLIAFSLPLLPLYGDGSGPFIFSSLLVWWSNAVVVAVGILYLKRDRVGVAGGLFLAAALTVAIAIFQLLLQTAPHFGRWQTDLVLVLEIIEGGLLALAATRAIGVRAANDLEAGQ